MGKGAAVLAWTYTLRWALPHPPCSGPLVLARVEVAPGAPCPEAVTAQWRPGCGCAVCLDFAQAPLRRWSPERKAAARQRRLAARVYRTAPLFADELIARELAARPDYYTAQAIEAAAD